MTHEPDPPPLSPRHARFVAEYLTDLNATQAYIRAGYGPHDAAASASKLLRQPPIQAAVAAGQQRLVQALELNAERVVAEYMRIAFANIDDYIAIDDDGDIRVDLAKSTRDQRAGLVEVTITKSRARKGEAAPAQRVKIRLANKLQALNALARHLGMFVRKPAPAPAPVRVSLGEAMRGYSVEENARYRAERAARQTPSPEPAPAVAPTVAPPRPRPAIEMPPAVRRPAEPSLPPPPRLPPLPYASPYGLPDSAEALRLHNLDPNAVQFPGVRSPAVRRRLGKSWF